MAITSDMGAICIGAALGYGLRNEIRCAGSIAKNGLLAGLSAAATTAVLNDQIQAGQGQSTQSTTTTNGGKKNDH